MLRRGGREREREGGRWPKKHTQGRTGFIKKEPWNLRTRAFLEMDFANAVGVG